MLSSCCKSYSTVSCFDQSLSNLCLLLYMWLLFYCQMKKKHVIWLICLGVGGQEWDVNIDKNKAEQIFVMLLVTLGLHCPRTSVGKSLAMEFVTMFQSSIQCKAKTDLWVRQFHWVFVNPKLIVLWKCTKVTLWNNELQNLANYSFHKYYTVQEKLTKAEMSTPCINISNICISFVTKCPILKWRKSTIPEILDPDNWIVEW